MAVEVQPGVVHGFCDERFSDVGDEFRRNFAERGELGASVTVIEGGRTVVDLWGGHADAERTREWDEDTIAVVFSCTKGAVALCAHMLAVEGFLDFDAPVRTYWPEYAQAGKEETLVRHLLSHQAGLPAVRTPLEPGAFYDWERIIAVLESEEPFWKPGTRHGYHALTYGFLVGEVIRRVAGVSVGAFLRDEVAAPLGLDLSIGLPASEHARVARVNAPPPPAPGEPVSPYLMTAMTDPTSMQALMLANNGGYLMPVEWDSPAALAAEIPAAGGVGNARSLAGMYSALAHASRVGRVAFSREDIVRMGAVQSAAGEDAMIFAPGRWTLGFMKGATSPRGVEPAVRVVLSEDAFGHTGHGGSIGFADPGADLAFGYVMNQMDPDLGLSAKGQSLVDAAYRSIGYTNARGERWVQS